MLLAVSAVMSLLLLPLFENVDVRKALKDTSTNLLFAAAVGVAFHWTGSRLTALLRTRMLRYFGRISYCAYLVDLPPIYHFGFPLAFLMTVALSTGSFYLFEEPVLRLKERFTRVGPAVCAPGYPMSH